MLSFATVFVSFSLLVGLHPELSVALSLGHAASTRIFTVQLKTIICSLFVTILLLAIFY